MMLFDIQRWSLHDGPGIRTTVFFKGCPLRCIWCSNPESWNRNKDWYHFKHRCSRCGTCVKNCTRKAVRMEGQTIRHSLDLCSFCGMCADLCPENALEPVGFDMGLSEIMQVIEKDSIFYHHSGGGVSFSGGEPFSQAGPLRALTDMCLDRGIHTCIETSGYFEFDQVSDILAKISLIHMEIKHTDDQIHRKLTGVSNRKIIQNIIKTDAMGKTTIIRIPLIKDLTDTDLNIREIIKLITGLRHVSMVELMDYHKFGISKYDALGLDYDSGIAFSPRKAEIMESFYKSKIKCK